MLFRRKQITQERLYVPGNILGDIILDTALSPPFLFTYLWKFHPADYTYCYEIRFKITYTWTSFIKLYDCDTQPYKIVRKVINLLYLFLLLWFIGTKEMQNMLSNLCVQKGILSSRILRNKSESSTLTQWRNSYIFYSKSKTLYLKGNKNIF
jgi:hypothetical protein